MLEASGELSFSLNTIPKEADPTPVDIALTLQQRTVLKLLEQDYAYEQIAQELHISVNTVRTHVRKLYEKLGVSRRAQALWRAREAGLL